MPTTPEELKSKGGGAFYTFEGFSASDLLDYFPEEVDIIMQGDDMLGPIFQELVDALVKCQEKANLLYSLGEIPQAHAWLDAKEELINRLGYRLKVVIPKDSQRSRVIYKDNYSLPSVQIKQGETAEQAMRRLGKAVFGEQMCLSVDNDLTYMMGTRGPNGIEERVLKSKPVGDLPHTRFFRWKAPKSRGIETQDRPDFIA